MERSVLRELVGAILHNDSDFSAFCSDYFTDVYRRFSHGMDRVAKVTLLLDCAEHASILDRLREINPKRVWHYEQPVPVLDGYIDHLSEAAIKIVSERQSYWEYKLFSQVLSDELTKFYFDKKDLDLELTFEQGILIEKHNYSEWASLHINSIVRFANNLSKIFEIALKESFGEPGQPGDPGAIVYSAKRISDCYKAAIVWSLEWKRIRPPAEFQKLADIASKYSKGIIFSIEDFNKQFQSELGQIGTADENKKITITLALFIPEDVQIEFNEELQKVQERLEFHEYDD